MSKLEVNTIEPQCGTTLTLGGSGDTVTLASGASQSGFGRSGSVNWDTSIKTTGFTAVSGNGYFCNTSGGGFTVTLPASPSVGDIVAVSDYAKTFDTANLTIGRNSVNIEGAGSDLTLDAEGLAMTFVYADATKGWKVVGAGREADKSVPLYVTATGGNTIATSGDYKIHTFTGPGTFCVSVAGNACGSNTVDYLVVAGGGGGGYDNGGGGGGGGFRLSNSTSMASGLTSPLATPTGLTVTATGYPIVVGAGGSGGTSAPGGCAGSNSSFSTITSAGGGEGAPQGGDGGSGGGNCSATPTTKGAGNTPSVSPPQGNPGGLRSPSSPAYAGGGGGGAGAAGSCSGPTGGPGGAGSYALNGDAFAGTNGTTGPVTDARYFAGGGGGGGQPYSPAPANQGTGGAGGGGNGFSPQAGGTNTGGGGGGGSSPNAGGTGGSGIVIIRYKYQ